MRTFARTHLRVFALLTVCVLHAVLHTSATDLLLALSPLLLLVGRDASGQWAMRAAVAWLLFTAAALAFPNVSAAYGLRSVVSLAVLAVVLWRLSCAQAAMRELTRRDPLTGLLNRRGFDEAATHELRRASRYARPLTFALIDIDRFKAVNDRLGHGFGDLVLKIVAAELNCLRGSDLAVRLGGDEFGVLMPETNELGAELLLQRVQECVRERTAEKGWPVTLSLGIVGLETPDPTSSVQTLIAEADQRMYRMKRGMSAAIDGDDVALWDPGPSAMFGNRPGS